MTLLFLNYIPIYTLGWIGLLAVENTEQGTASNQYYMITAILALTGTIVYLHKNNQKSADAKDIKDDLKFTAFVSHHEQLIAKIDDERTAMTAERVKRIEALMLLIEKNATANEHQASAIRELTEMIRERITPVNPNQKL